MLHYSFYAVWFHYGSLGVLLLDASQRSTSDRICAGFHVHRRHGKIHFKAVKEFKPLKSVSTGLESADWL